MRSIETVYRDTAVVSRIKTDKLYRADNAKFDYSGAIDKAIRFVEQEHMLNPKMWELFVKQFALHTDAFPDNSEGRDGWRGEYFGKMMRGAAVTYLYTHNEDLYQTVTDAVNGLLDTQDELGRISTYSLENEFGNWDLWCRKYVMLGLQYYYDICRDDALKTRIIKALRLHGDYIMSKIGRACEGKREITLTGIEVLKGLNASSILEPFVRMYNLTQDKKYLDYAAYIVESGATDGENIFELALEDKKYPFEYSVKKAYEMMSCFEGLLEYYRVTGIEKYKTAVTNFVRRLAESDVTVIGGLGCSHELLDNASKRQTDVTNTLLMQETCVTVTWIKLCMQMLFLTGESRYADFIEQSVYNAMLGAVNDKQRLFDFESHEKYVGTYKSHTDNGVTDIGMPFDSYSPLLAGKRGGGIGGLKLMENYSYYGCCACIGGMGTGLMAMLSFVYSKNGFVQNLYINGTATLVTPKGNEFSVDIKTGYPADGRVLLTVTNAPDETVEYALRIPAWSNNTVAKLNGTAIDCKAGTYLSLSRKWEKGDTAELIFDTSPQVTLQDGFACIRVGALVLARSEEFGEDIDAPVSFDFENPILEKINNSDFDSQVCYNLYLKDGGKIKLADYASSGKYWDKRIAAWFAAE